MPGGGRCRGGRERETDGWMDGLRKNRRGGGVIDGKRECKEVR